MDRAAHAVSVGLRRSWLEVAWVAGLAFATLAVAFTLPFDRAWHALVPTAPVVWALVQGLRMRRQRWVTLTVDLERRLQAVDACGAVHQGRLAASSYVGARVVTLAWRPAGALRSRATWLLPDMLSDDDARRLRVTLRYGHSGASQGAPRNHA